MESFGEILDGVEYKERKGVYGIAVNHKGEIAVIAMPHGDFLPGGGIEADETKEACLRRELIEETGYNIDVGAYVCSSMQYGFAPHSKRYLKLVGDFYKITLKEDTGMKTEEDHHMAWKSISELKDSMRLGYQLWAIEESLKL